MTGPQSNDTPQDVNALPGDDSAAAAPSRPKNRRAQVIASVFLLIAAGLLWAASRMVWARVYTENDLTPPVIYDVLGTDWSPWLIAVAVFLLAALAVQFALHGVALRIVAVLVAVAGVLIAFPAISLLNSADASYATDVVDIPPLSEVVSVTANWEPGAVTLIAAICAVIGAVAMIRSASGGRKMSSKYTSPAARREDLERRAFADYERRQAGGASSDEAAPTEREFWDSLDAGDDPTEDPGDRGI